MGFTRRNVCRFCALLLSYSLLVTLSVGSFATNKTAEQTFIKNTANQNAVNKNENPKQPSLTLEENRGQFDKRVRYMTRGNGIMTFLTANEIVYVMRNEENQSSKLQVPSSKSDDEKNPQSDAVALYMRLVGSNNNSTFTGVDEQEGHINYFRGDNPTNWQQGVRMFNRVNYESVYDGIDMSFYSNERGEFEYDFIVKPNTNRNQITLEIEGAEDVRINERGDLEIETKAGVITQRKPFTYQSTTENIKQEIQSSYKIETNRKSKIENQKSFTVKFDVGNYDQSKPLIIDPSVTLENLSFSTFVGGIQDDIGNDITVDNSGNVYITGRSLSPLFPTTPGTFDSTPNGNEDVFVTKLNASGTGIIFSTFLGGPFFDEGRGIDVDANGNVYVTGVASVSFPTTVGAFDTTFNGGSDVFVTKLNAAGTALVYSTYIGASSADSAAALTVDSSNNVYIAGRTSDAIVDYPTTAGAFDTTFNGVDDAFVTKLNDTGTALVYSTFLGGSHIDTSASIVVDANQEVYVAGSTTDDVTDFPTTSGAFDTTHNGNTDFYVAKINSAGSALVYSTFIGGPGIDNCNGLAVDNAGSAYVTGAIGTGFPTTVGVVDTTAAGSNEGGLSKLNSTGSALTYSTYFGGTQGESGNGVAVDSLGYAYVVGDSFGSPNDYPTTTGAFDTTFNGGSDVVLTVFNTGATAYFYSTFFGGTGSELGNDIALDASGNVYITGQTANAATNLPTTTNAAQTTQGGALDAYIAKFGDFVIAGRTVDANGAAISGAAVSLSGNIAELKMTDSQGYFAFTDTEAGENYTVAASRNGTTFNPALFNITGIARNKQVIFIGTAGAPTGHPGGMFRVFPIQNVNENNEFITIAIERVEVFSPNVASIDYRTAEGTASNNDDFIPQQGTLTFLPFEMIKIVDVRITDDKFQENDETFTLTLSNPTGGTGLSENFITQITIADNDVQRRRPKPRVIIP